MNFQQPQARTARQLMDDVLTQRHPVGLEHRLGPDRTGTSRRGAHPAGHVDGSPGCHCQCGRGYPIPHPSDQSIRVRHRYPTAPWEWNTVTPDFVLLVDAVARESLRW